MIIKKHFTPRDIEQLIPKLEKIFEHIDSCRRRVGILVTPVEPLKAPADPVERVSPPLIRSQVEFLLEAVQDNVDHISTLGGIAKDLDTGLVDFPGRVEGEEVWLSWKRGEKKVRYWHLQDQGIEELQTLPQSSSTMSH
ncbi:MAG: DUF2203 domain-containing protein [Elusimicrobiota bacterium]|jgi:hypothetical protein